MLFPFQNVFPFQKVSNDVTFSKSMFPLQMCFLFKKVFPFQMWKINQFHNPFLMSYVLIFMTPRKKRAILIIKTLGFAGLRVLISRFMKV